MPVASGSTSTTGDALRTTGPATTSIPFEVEDDATSSSATAVNFDPMTYDFDLDLQSLLAFPAEASFSNTLGPSELGSGPPSASEIRVFEGASSTKGPTGLSPNVAGDNLGGAWATGFGALTGHAAPFSWP